MSDPEALAPDYIDRGRWRFKEAVNRCHRECPTDPDGVFGALFAWHWLRREIHPRYRKEVLAVSRNPEHRWLAELLAEEQDEADFVVQLLKHHASTADPEGIVAQWRALGVFGEGYAEGVRRIQREQKRIATEMGGAEDRQRLALVDALPDNRNARPPRFGKAGFIPRMACPKSCRHCMFVWRPVVPDGADAQRLLRWLAGRTDALLFTGGDLTRHLPDFFQAVRSLETMRSLAILLNGECAATLEGSRAIFEEARRANRMRGRPAEVVLQVSCDEYHQEVVASRSGGLRERIPVAFIANLVQTAVAFPDIRLALLHKQNRLNFSTDLFSRGVVARLARELRRRGERLQVKKYGLSPRPKADPLNRARLSPVIREAELILASRPEVTITFFSSIIDAFGRAALLDPSEFIDERHYLQEILAHGPPSGERFDIDPMVRADGVVTCFAANPLWLGNVFEEGEEVILARWRKDPLLTALSRFDPTLLTWYDELTGDAAALVNRSTGPHFLFSTLTERAAVRLHLTRRLLGVFAKIQ
ncbi:MAG: hypothetical protein HQM03_15830 [Magnetococcales bacterium]|nr:hypothetical protein [Magnetococcales bacterium]